MIIVVQRIKNTREYEEKYMNNQIWNSVEQRNFLKKRKKNG